MTLDILICTLNKGIVRIEDVISAPRPNVNYIIAYQYTAERYLELIPQSLTSRTDVQLFPHKGQGLSSNRNYALERATADLVLFSDDDSRLTEDAFEIIFSRFSMQPELDIAYFRARTYTGKLLKKYPEQPRQITALPSDYSVSAIEMVCRREKVQGIMRFDERFGLGTKFLTCREEDIWLIDALKHRLNIHYFPELIIETSTLLKRRMIYVDAGVQRSEGAFTYYVHGNLAYLYCFAFAFNCARKRLCHFYPMLKHLYQGIDYLKRNS